MSIVDGESSQGQIPRLLGECLVALAIILKENICPISLFLGLGIFEVFHF